MSRRIIPPTKMGRPFKDPAQKNKTVTISLSPDNLAFFLSLPDGTRSKEVNQALDFYRKNQAASL